MEIVELSPHLHLVKLVFGQAYLWRDGDELTLIDTGIAGCGRGRTPRSPTSSGPTGSRCRRPAYHRLHRPQWTWR